MTLFQCHYFRPTSQSVVIQHQRHLPDEQKYLISRTSVHLHMGVVSWPPCGLCNLRLGEIRNPWIQANLALSRAFLAHEGLAWWLPSLARLILFNSPSAVQLVIISTCFTKELMSLVQHGKDVCDQGPVIFLTTYILNLNSKGIPIVRGTTTVRPFPSARQDHKPHKASSKTERLSSNVVLILWSKSIWAWNINIARKFPSSTASKILSPYSLRTKNQRMKQDKAIHDGLISTEKS